jgi:hypothetical protein
MPRHEQNAGQKEAAAVRRVKALDLRIGGLPYRAIAAALGVSVHAAHGDVKRALSELAKLEASKAEDVRRLELERIDAAVAGLWPLISRQEGAPADPKAVNALVNLMDRRAKLLGLDAPQRVHLGNDGPPFKVYEGMDPEKMAAPESAACPPDTPTPATSPPPAGATGPSGPPPS